MNAAPVPAAVLADAAATTREWMRTGEADEPAVLARLCAAAFQVAEAFVGELLVARACEDVMRADGWWRPLNHAPVSGITGVATLPVAGVPTTMAAEGYAVDIDAGGTGWLRLTTPVTGAPAGQVAVSYTAGRAGDWATIPAPVAQGIAMLAAHLSENRASETAPPAAVAALWRPFRRLRLGRERRA